MTDTASPRSGILWMITSGLCFVAVTAGVKALGPTLPAIQSAFVRYLLGLVVLIPMAPTLLRLRLSGRQWRLFTLRAAAHAVGVVTWFYAMTRIPLAEVTAMGYLTPVLTTLGAALLLSERLPRRRLAAVAVALIGALIILRPGMRTIDPGHIAMLTTALMFSVGYLLTKRLTGEVSAAVIVAMLSLMVPIALAPMAIAVWQPPTWTDLTVLSAVAAAATAGHYAMTRAFAAAPLTATQPVTFLQLVWSVTLGALVFGEPIDPFVILGGSIIVAAVTFIAWRETVAARS